MNHLKREETRAQKTPAEWLKVGAAIGKQTNAWSGRYDIIAYVGPGAGNPSPMACFNLDTAEVELNVEAAFGELTPDLIPDFTLTSTHRDFPKAAGAVWHEAMHARFTRYMVSETSPLGVALKALAKETSQRNAVNVFGHISNFEETRIEAIGLRMYPDARPYIRAAAIAVTMSGLAEDLAAGKIASVRAFAHLAAVIPARVSAGVFEQEDVQDVEDLIIDFLGVKNYEKLESIWKRTQKHEAHTNPDFLIKRAIEWEDILKEIIAEKKAEKKAEKEKQKQEESKEQKQKSESGESPDGTPQPGGKGEGKGEGSGSGSTPGGEKASKPEKSEEKSEEKAGDTPEEKSEGSGEEAKPEEEKSEGEGSGSGDEESEESGEEEKPAEPEASTDADEESDEEDDASEDMSEIMDKIQEILDAIEEAGESVQYAVVVEIGEMEDDERKGVEKESRKVRETQKQAAQTEAAKVFGTHSAEIGKSRSRSQLVKTEVPSTELRAAAIQVGRQLEKAKYHERDEKEISTILPPGKLRTRTAVQGAAYKAKGSMTQVAPFRKTVRKHTDDPSLTVGVMVDISGSMNRAMLPMANTAWIMSEAVRRVQGKCAMVYYGNDVFATLKPGEHLKDVQVYNAGDGTEEFDAGFKALDGALDLLYGNGARLLVVVSDGHYTDKQRPLANKWLKECAKNGVAVLWMQNYDDVDEYLQIVTKDTAAQVVSMGKNPADAAMAIGKAAADALTIAGQR